MSKVLIAVVYAFDVLDGEQGVEQVATWERITHAIPEPAGSKVLFASGVFHAREADVNDPDFDVTVRAHDRTLEQIDFP